MKTLQIVRMLAVCVTLMAPRVLPGQSCSVPFDTGTVKPSMWDSLVTVLRSFNPKGEAQRLGTLRQRVQQLKDDKHELSDTLNTVIQQNSVPSWLDARVKQIPDVQNKALVLIDNIRSEADQGGLFVGDKAFSDLSELLNKKGHMLNQLCVLAQQPLPLNPSLRQQLQSLVNSLNLEVDSLGKIDDEIGTLIQKAHDEEVTAKTKQK